MNTPVTIDQLRELLILMHEREDWAPRPEIVVQLGGNVLTARGSMTVKQQQHVAFLHPPERAFPADTTAVMYQVGKPEPVSNLLATAIHPAAVQLNSQ